MLIWQFKTWVNSENLKGMSSSSGNLIWKIPPACKSHYTNVGPGKKHFIELPNFRQEKCNGSVGYQLKNYFSIIQNSCPHLHRYLLNNICMLASYVVFHIGYAGSKRDWLWPHKSSRTAGRLVVGQVSFDDFLFSTITHSADCNSCPLKLAVNGFPGIVLLNYFEYAHTYIL